MIPQKDSRSQTGSGRGGSCHPICFVYMDELSARLNGVPTGCLMGETKINHLMYADDIVLLSPMYIVLYIESRLLGIP